MIPLTCNVQTFAIRFKTSEQALEFPKRFIAGQSEMTALVSGADGAAPATAEDKKADEEVVKAIESLAVNSKEEIATKAEEATA